MSKRCNVPGCSDPVVVTLLISKPFSDQPLYNPSHKKHYGISSCWYHFSDNIFRTLAPKLGVEQLMLLVQQGRKAS